MIAFGGVPSCVNALTNKQISIKNQVIKCYGTEKASKNAVSDRIDHFIKNPDDRHKVQVSQDRGMYSHDHDYFDFLLKQAALLVIASEDVDQNKDQFMRNLRRYEYYHMLESYYPQQLECLTEAVNKHLSQSTLISNTHGTHTGEPDLNTINQKISELSHILQSYLHQKPHG
jgi:hypothetical protein